MARKQDAVSRATSMIIGFAGRIIALALLILLLFKGVTAAYSFGHSLLYQHGMEAAPGTAKTLVIEQTDGRNQIADKLLKEGLIDNRSAFLLQSVLYEAEFASGSYELNTSMTVEDILLYLSEEARKQQKLETAAQTRAETKAETSAAAESSGEDAAEETAE